ncbi:hypothetical protein [Nocardia sp. R7R-8]|uniref:hypothetical protein n=1 Tax=Nocardia sp. R7R-8 TaxID=3459304 RepID=UPI00403D8FB9
MREQGYRVIGPHVRGSAIVPDELDSGRRLPAGWGVGTGIGCIAATTRRCSRTPKEISSWNPSNPACPADHRIRQVHGSMGERESATAGVDERLSRDPRGLLRPVPGQAIGL